MNFQDFFRLQINLDSTPTTASHYSIPGVVADTDDVPIDVRIRQVTPATHATRLTAASDAADFFSRFYTQEYPSNPANARKSIAGYVIRWVSAASSPYRVFPNAEDTASVWVALTSTGSFNIDDGTNDEDINPDFTGDTDMDDVAASITAAFVASTNFTGYTCTVDAMDRLIISNGATGASAVSFTLDAPAAGTDLTLAAYLGDATAFDQAGLDAETLGAAVLAAIAKDNTPTVFFERGANDTQRLAFLTAMDAVDGKFTVVLSSDTDHENSENTTNLGYLAEAQEFDKCHVIYDRSDVDSDAAIYGEILPREEGRTDFALTPADGVYPSGMEADGVTPAEVSDAAVEALDTFRTDFWTKPVNDTHLARGLCPNGDEVRIVLCKQWCEYNASLEGYQLLVTNDVSTFSDIFLGQIKGIVERYMDECVDRKCIDAGYTIDLPSASEFTAAEKASHNMSLAELVAAAIQFAVNTVFMSSTWSAS